MGHTGLEYVLKSLGYLKKPGSKTLRTNRQHMCDHNSAPLVVLGQGQSTRHLVPDHERGRLIWTRPMDQKGELNHD